MVAQMGFEATKDGDAQTQINSGETFWEVHGNIYISFNSVRNTQARLNTEQAAGGPQWVVLSVEIENNDLGIPLHSDFPVSLEDIYRFEQAIGSALEEYEGSNIVICAGPIRAGQLQTAFLIGCHIILKGCDCDEVCMKFGHVQPCLSIAHELDLSLRDFWSAFHQADRMGWINFHGSVNCELEENELDIAEYLH